LSTKEERAKALAFLMFLKEKSGKLAKARMCRMCTNGLKQRGDSTHPQGKVTWQPGNDFYFSGKWTDVINMIKDIKNIITDFTV
jgi:hypothetical protein